jgi:hypothetical protein
VIVFTIIKISLYSFLEPGIFDNKVKMNIKNGGIAIKKLNAIEAALSFNPIC